MAGGARFVVTEECRRLARWLRLMGYDATLASPRPLSALYRTAYQEGRVVVTRNRTVRASGLFRVLQLRSVALDAQLRQLVRELKLDLTEDRWFSRCDVCNVEVEPVEKIRVRDHVPPYVYQTQQRFYRCPSCLRIYWAATHWQRARTMLARLRT